MPPKKTVPTVQIKPVRLGDLVIDKRVQRAELRPATIREIRKDFDLSSVGPLTSSLRDSGEHVLIDGAHRVFVLSELYGEDYKHPSEIHVGLSLVDEAKLFRRKNRQRPPSILDIHNVAITEGDPRAVAIKTAVEEHGWTVGTSAGQISAIGALQWIYDEAGERYSEGFGAQLLSNTIAVLTGAWGRDDAKAMNQNVLKATAMVLWAAQKNVVDQGGDFDIAELTDAMADIHPRGVQGWIKAQRGTADAEGKAPRQTMADSLIKAYNKTTKGAKLPRSVRADALMRSNPNR